MMSITEMIRALFIASLLIIVNVESSPKKVCVIGAGRAGLAVIKIVADQIGKFTPIAFERNSDVGGLWIYTNKTDFDKHMLPIQSGVYENLRTITKKEAMVYPGYPKFITTDPSPFVSHEVFLKYMRNYADDFGLRKYIQFNTVVTKVKPEDDKAKQGRTRWLIENRNLDTNENNTTICDAVVVCNGRFSKPNIPKLPGIETFPGRVLHSQAYRKPDIFKDQRVLIWGSGASALGIARDLSGNAKKIFISALGAFVHEPETLPENVSIVDNLVGVDGSNFILEDNSRITADAIIYCTGYVYDFPFFDEDIGIAPDKYRLFPLRNRFINKKYPTMAFIGLNDNDNGRTDYYYHESKIFLSTLK